jgi:hypothetical protein
MRVTFWQKIEEAKAKGLTMEQFEQIERLEEAIAYHENKIEEYEHEIKRIEEGANSKERSFAGIRMPGGSNLAAFGAPETVDF